MTHICIVGAGPAGSTLALELASSPGVQVTLIDIDRLSAPFNRALKIAIEISSGSLGANSKTVGYGFGGTSNLWHGVLTRLDDEDLRKFPECLKNQLRDAEEKANSYFNAVMEFDSDIDISDHSISPYFDFTKLVGKRYFVQNRPTRFRKFFTKFKDKKFRNRINLVDNCVAVKFIYDGARISGLLCSKNGVEKIIKADVFVCSAGALESPRLLQQSFEGTRLHHQALGKGLMDHPYVMVGEIILPKRIIYRQHGQYSPLFPTSQRIGFQISPENRSRPDLNHSLFFRPAFGGEFSEIRESLRLLLFGEVSFRNFQKIFRTSFLKTLFTLVIEKLGVGFWTTRLMVSAQLEQEFSTGGRVTLSDRLDEYGRRIPLVDNPLPELLRKEAAHIQTMVSSSVASNAAFYAFPVTKDCFESGAHHSGTCRIGKDHNDSVVDQEMRYHGLENLYVCDASIFPCIGNANLTYSICCMSIICATNIRKNCVGAE